MGRLPHSGGDCGVRGAWDGSVGVDEESPGGGPHERARVQDDGGSVRRDRPVDPWRWFVTMAEMVSMAAVLSHVEGWTRAEAMDLILTAIAAGATGVIL